MAYIQNKGVIAPTIILSADWTNSGTITVSYPSGYSQKSFYRGSAKANGSYVIKNGKDKVAEDTTAASGIALSFGSSNITVTNNTGATIAAGTSLDFWLDQNDGNKVLTLQFPVDLVDVSAADVVTDFYPGVDGTIEDVQWVQRTPVTTAAKAATVTPKINTTALTGGVLSLTSAACTPLGVIVAGTQVTGANRITRNDTIRLTASSVTTFAEGKGSIFVRIRLDD
jgi:hypothetical protein